MSSSFRRVIAVGVAPYLEHGEQVLAAMSASIRGRSQLRAGNIVSQAIGRSHSRKSRSAARNAGVALPKSQTLGLVVTNHRFLFLGLGLAALVTEFASAIPIARVNSIHVRRTGLGGTTTLMVGESQLRFEGRVGPGRELEAALSAVHDGNGMRYLEWQALEAGR
jgi:hypothetical protein